MGCRLSSRILLARNCMAAAMMAQHTMTRARMLRVVFLRILPLRLFLLPRMGESAFFPNTIYTLLFNECWAHRKSPPVFAVGRGIPPSGKGWVTLAFSIPQPERKRKPLFQGVGCTSHPLARYISWKLAQIRLAAKNFRRISGLWGSFCLLKNCGHRVCDGRRLSIPGYGGMPRLAGSPSDIPKALPGDA